MVGSEGDLVLPARVHELDQLGREVLQRVGRAGGCARSQVDPAPDPIMNSDTYLPGGSSSPRNMGLHACAEPSSWSLGALGD